MSLYRAFLRSRDLALRHMYDTDALTVSLPWVIDEIERSREIPWDYSIEGSRPTLEALVQYLDEQTAHAPPHERRGAVRAECRSGARISTCARPARTTRLFVERVDARAWHTTSSCEPVPPEQPIAPMIWPPSHQQMPPREAITSSSVR